MQKYDKAWFGLVTALVLPPVGYLLSYFVKFYPRPFSAYWRIFLNIDDEQTQIFTFAMLPSLFLFYFILFQWKMDIASKSFVGVSLLYVTIFVIIKFV